MSRKTIVFWAMKCLRVGQTFGTLYSRTLQREGVLKDNGYKLVCKWECEWRQELQFDTRVRQMYDFLVGGEVNALIRDPLNPREGLYGGRVDCNQMLWRTLPCTPMEATSTHMVKDADVRVRSKHLRYYDFTSLYPTVNKYCLYPEGHPIIFRNRKWTPQDFTFEKFFGLAHVCILPPPHLFHPVLPFRFECVDKYYKTLFVLCRTCAVESNFDLNSCKHDEEERALTGGVVHRRDQVSHQERI